MRDRNRTTPQLVDSLREFHHYDAADRLEKLHRILVAAKLCEHCGRPYDQCERKR